MNKSEKCELQGIVNVSTKLVEAVNDLADEMSSVQFRGMALGVDHIYSENYTLSEDVIPFKTPKYDPFNACAMWPKRKRTKTPQNHVRYNIVPSNKRKY